MKNFQINIYFFPVITFLIIITIPAAGMSQFKIKKESSQHLILDSIISKKIQFQDSVIFTPTHKEPNNANLSVHLKKNKEFIRVNEPVIFFAELSKGDKEAVYIFAVNTGEIFGSGRDVTEASHTFKEPGIFKVYVLARTRNQLLRDSLIVNVNESPSVDTPHNNPDYNVTLNVQNPHSKVGDIIRFEAISTLAKEDGLEYWFNFGDDKIIYKSKEPFIQYIYKRPDYYTARVQLALNNQPLPVFSTAMVIIEKAAKPYVKLTISNSTAFINDKITFTAYTNITGELEYEFYLGNNLRPIRTYNNTIQFAYTDQGRFPAFVKLFQNGKEAAESEVQNIIIKSEYEPASESDLWKYLIAVIAVIAAGIMIRKLFIKPVTVTFHPNPNSSLMNINGPKNFNVNCTLHLNPNLTNAKYYCSMEENIIKSKTARS